MLEETTFGQVAMRPGVCLLTGLLWLACSSDKAPTGGGRVTIDPPPLNLNSVVWTGSRFLAVGGSSLLSSVDGFDWTETVLAADSLRGLAVTSGHVVFIGDTATVFSSTSGSAFQRTVIDLPRPVLSIARSDAAWTAVGAFEISGASYGDVALCEELSPRREDWSLQFSSLTWSQILFDGSQFVTVGHLFGQGILGTSSDGSSWNHYSVDSVSEVLALELRDGVYCALGRGSLGPHRLIVSTDGETWNSQPLGITATPTGVTRSHALWLITDENGGVWRSSNGSSWYRTLLSEGHVMRDVVWANDQFVVVGDSALWISDDGYSWESRLPRQAIFQP